MEQHLSSRRRYLGVAGAVLGTGLAGCMGIGSASGLENADPFNANPTFELSGDGPGEPVTLSLGFGGNDFERTFQPGEEFETEVDSPQGNATIEVDYSEEEEVGVDLNWSREGLDLTIEIEQSRWNNTAGTVEISFENEQLTTAFDATVTLSEATTQITGTDTRTIQPETEYEVDISLSVEDDEVDGGLAIGWDDGEDEGEDEEDEDEEETEAEDDDDVDEETEAEETEVDEGDDAN